MPTSRNPAGGVGGASGNAVHATKLNTPEVKQAPIAKQAPAKSWREVLSIHPAADLFPLMSPDDLRELGADIKKNGLRVPVVVWKAQKHFPPVLLDGRNRLDAIEAAGMDVKVEHGGTELDPYVRLWRSGWPIQTVEVRGDHGNGDPYAYVISANVNRRHLTAEQKRELIAKLIKQQPNKSNRQIAATVKASHPTVAKVRDELEKKGDVEKVTTSIDTKGRKQAAKRAKQAKPKTANRGVPETRTTLEKRTSSLPTGSATEESAPKGNIGPNSAAEIDRTRDDLDVTRDCVGDVRDSIERAFAVIGPKERVELCASLRRLLLEFEWKASPPPALQMTEDDVWRLLKMKAQVRRNIRAMGTCLVDSGNGPEPATPTPLAEPNPGDLTVWRKVWPRLSAEDRHELPEVQGYLDRRAEA